MSTQPSAQLSPEDYLQWETQSRVKHEYINGQVSAMAGASDAHVTLALNLHLLVTCDPRDQQTPLYKSFPCLVIEVLSPSTEAFDRGDKFIDYECSSTC